MYPGSQDDNFLPFTCPMDHVLSPHDWKHVAFRDAAFLTSERLPPATRKRGIVDIDLVGRGAFDALSPERRARALPIGVSAAEARRLLESEATTREAPILRLPHTRDLICGIGGAKATREFNRAMQPVLRVPPWCSRCDRGCKKLLAKWLAPEQIGNAGRGSEWCLRTPPPPKFRHGQCVLNGA